MKVDPKIIVTDLDGTLLNSEGKISERNLNTLLKLGELGHFRVIATGRSLYSVKKVIQPDFPVDYIICSTGAAIVSWQKQELLKSYNLTRDEVLYVYELLMDMKVDFIIQEAVPENHKCYYLRHSENNPDFDKRNELYRGHIQPLDSNNFVPFESCQFIVISPGTDSLSVYNELKEKLKNLKIIRTTSPLDHQTLWIEIYSSEVSKANGIKFLSELHHIGVKNIMVIGNDYNDIDMLRYTKNSYLVGNAPDDLKQEFKSLNSHNEDGFSEAVELFLKN